MLVGESDLDELLGKLIRVLQQLLDALALILRQSLDLLDFAVARYLG